MMQINQRDGLAFGLDKAHRLPEACYACPVLFACNGGCPRHRLAEPGQATTNHLCAGYRAYFAHADGPMRAMAQLYRQGRSPARIVETGSRLSSSERASRAAHQLHFAAACRAGRPTGR